MAFLLPFAILTLIAIWLTVVLFRNFSDAGIRQPATVGMAHV
jgi:hypothetical protein